ncbi:hypothetical protein OF001_U120036 [Pseudomonas sp. OF001]|nr:hypothetical protein OF001_U120036 [Pseudomonas sp. OF001]
MLRQDLVHTRIRADKPCGQPQSSSFDKIVEPMWITAPVDNRLVHTQPQAGYAETSR